MKVSDIVSSNVYDENEQVVVLYGNVNAPHRPFTGRLSNIPTDLHDKEVSTISAMGELRRNRWNLNQYGWLEIWIEEE